MESLAHLRQLLALADTANYRKAGERLGISHSAISQTISKLEHHYGVELFNRRRSETLPTVFGERVISSARTIVTEIDQAVRDVRLMQNLEGGGLMVGADPNVCEGLLAPALGRLMNSYPKLKFKVEICNWDEAESKLIHRLLDVYLGLHPSNLADSISYKEIKLLAPIVACNGTHPLGNKKKLQMGDLIKYPIIGGDFPDWFLKKIVAAYPDHFHNIESLRSIFLTSQDLSLLRRMLLSTEAVALLPKSLILNDLDSGALIPLQVEGFPFRDRVPGVFAYLQDYPQPPAAARLIMEIEDLLREARIDVA